MLPSNRNRRGVSLTELAIVLGVIAAILGGIWTYISIASQNSKVEAAVEAVNLTVESARSAYVASASITGGISTVVPYLVSHSAMPSHLLNNSSTTCSGTGGYYGFGPFGGSDACGTFRLCAWTSGIGAATSAANNECAQSSGSSAQYMALEFINVNKAACISLVTKFTPTYPIGGLADIYVNGASGYALSSALPVTVSGAQGLCTNASSNVVDFVYTLRPPVTS